MILPRLRLLLRVELLLLAFSLVPVLTTASDLLDMLAGRPAGLLVGKLPVRAVKVHPVAVLTDGERAHDGDFWNSDLVAELEPGGFVEYDLGAEVQLRAAYVQGDADDEVVLSGSVDGEIFTPIWRATDERGGGVRPRSTSSLHASARFVRLEVVGGDGRYGVSEVQLFREVPSELPSGLTVRRSLPRGERMRASILALVLALGALVFAVRRESSRAWLALFCIGPLAAAHGVVRSMLMEWPVPAQDVSFVRAAVAAIALIAVGRELASRASWEARPRIVVGVLALSAVLSVAAFFNLGGAQFYDHHAQRGTFVHSYDMRIYYPAAKYFHELGYTGVYEASVAALADDEPGTTLASLGDQEIRDLTTHRMVRVRDAMKTIEATRARFSPERWRAFVEDMRYFRESMGRGDYLGSMVDHGANATPVWLALALVLFAWTHAGESTLLVTALIDPLLLLIAFLAAYRAFGVRAMLVSIVVFGANDFIMLGSNWAGATLRHDWLAFLILGVCALRVRRTRTAGVLLALAACSRAFPAVALVAVASPAAAWWLAQVREHRRMPTFRALREAHPDILRVFLAAAITTGAMVLASGLILGFDAWPGWVTKVTLLDQHTALNHVSLRALIAGVGDDQSMLLASRLPLLAGAVLAAVIACMVLAARRTLDQAAILGCFLIPVLFNAANYYIHFITLLPLLIVVRSGVSAVRRHGATWVSLLLLCMAQYWTTLERDVGTHFQLATVLLCSVLAVLVALSFRDDARNRSEVG